MARRGGAGEVEKPGKEFYIIKGRQMPRVTTILSVLSKPALAPWYAKQEREYFKTALERALRLKGKVSYEKVEEIVKEAKQAERTKQAAAEKGRDLHSAIHLFLTGRRPELAEDTVPAFELWRKWWTMLQRRHKVKVLDVEKTIYDEKNGYAGTMDIRFALDGDPVIADWKSSNHIYGEYHLQNIAYRHAASLLGMKSTAGFVVRIPRDGQGEVETAKCPPEIVFEDFLAVFQAWRVWRKLQGRKTE